MIRNYSTGATKFVKYIVNAPDGRFGAKKINGGITLKTAMFHAKQYDEKMIIDIFDSVENSSGNS